SQLKTGHPVRSAIHKQLNGRLVLRWVTTWESLLLYVLLSESTSVSIQFYAAQDLAEIARFAPRRKKADARTFCVWLPDSSDIYADC
ncbi:hypothetical protein KCU63_g7210, partial [Aureobasidium melanogenum]